MKVLLSAGIWNDNCLISPEVISTSNKEDFAIGIKKFLYNLRFNLERLPNNKVGYQVEYNVLFTFTSSNFKTTTFEYDDLYTDKTFNIVQNL